MARGCEEKTSIRYERLGGGESQEALEEEELNENNDEPDDNDEILMRQDNKRTKSERKLRFDLWVVNFSTPSERNAFYVHISIVILSNEYTNKDTNYFI